MDISRSSTRRRRKRSACAVARESSVTPSGASTRAPFDSRNAIRQYAVVSPPFEPPVMTIGCCRPFSAAARPTLRSSDHVLGGRRPSASTAERRDQKPAEVAHRETPQGPPPQRGGPPHRPREAGPRSFPEPTPGRGWGRGQKAP